MCIRDRFTKEGFLPGGQGAAAGGITTVIEMPQAGPTTTTVALFRAKRDRIGQTAIVDTALWAGYEACAARQRASAMAERRRHPRLRGLSSRARALRERQMCVVASARVDAEILRWLHLDEDDEALEARRELAAGGLL